MNVVNEIGALPTRNASEVQFESATSISGEAMHEPRGSEAKPNLVTNQACFGCTIACGRIARVDKEHYTVVNRPEYWNASGGLEYESAWSMGADLGVDDLDALTFANFICNEQGFDPITFGATLAAAMELYEMGVITDEDTGGVALKFGSAEALTTMAELTATGQGFGKVLGLGSKRLCEKYGHPGLSMSVKGLHSRENRSPGNRGQGCTGKGIPGRHGCGGFQRALPVYHLCLDAGRFPSADRCCV